MRHKVWIIRCVLVLSVFLCPLVIGAANTWEFAGWYGGGCYPNFEFDPQVKGRVYLTSDVAGLWRSNDYGDHWFFATQGLGNLMVADVEVAPSNSDVLYAATGSGVFVSRDAAVTWKKADTVEKKISFKRPVNYRPIAIAPDDPARLCVGTAKGKVFCSSDYGTSWKELGPGAFSKGNAVKAVVFDPTGQVLYVAAGGISRCDMAVGQCEPLTNGPPKVTDLALSKDPAYTIFVTGDKTVWYSADQGKTWSQTSAIPKGSADRMEITSAAGQTVIRVVWISGWNGGIYLSNDMGRTWTSQDANLAGDKVYNPTRVWAKGGGKTTSVKVDPSNPDIIFRTDWWGVWRSDNGGLNWSEKVMGAPNTVVTQVRVTTDGAIYASSMDNGLLRSADNGKTYQPLFPKVYSDNESGHVWRVATAGNTIIATSSPWNKKINQVIVSNDGGASFSATVNGLPSKRPATNTMWGEGYPRGLAVDPNNPATVYLGIDGDDGGGLFVSKDSGMTWQPTPGQPGSKRIYYGLAVDPTDSKRILWGASGKGGGAYVSLDGGVTFKNNLKQMQWVFDVAIASDGTMYAAGDSNGAKLFVSRNHGASWSLSKDFGKSGALGSVAVNPENPAQIAVSTTSWNSTAPCHIFLSSDSGKTWNDVTGVLPDGTGAATLAFDPANKYLYAGRYAGSIYRLRLE